VTSVLATRTTVLEAPSTAGSDAAYGLFFDPFNLALLCPIVPQEADIGTAGIYEYTLLGRVLTNCSPLTPFRETPTQS